MSRPDLVDDAGASRGTSTLSAPEAAEHLGIDRCAVSRLARAGLVDAVKVDGQWLIDGASLAAYRRRIPRPAQSGPRVRRLPAGPLLRQVALRGGSAALGEAMGPRERHLYDEAARSGTLTVWAADHLAVRLLGMTLWDLWDVAEE